MIDLASLVSFYGPLAQPPSDAFAVYVWEVLGMRTTCGRRDAALAALHRIPAMTPDSVRKLGRGRLESIVRLCGPFVDERLSAIETGVDVFRRRRDFAAELAGPLRTAWLASRDLPQIGDAGAARLLLFATTHALVPVDQGICRLAVRLGIVSQWPNLRRLSREVRRALDARLPAELPVRRQAVLYLAHHAQSTCIEGEPHCGICPLVRNCDEGRRRTAEGRRAEG